MFLRGAPGDHAVDPPQILPSQGRFGSGAEPGFRLAAAATRAHRPFCHARAAVGGVVGRGWWCGGEAAIHGGWPA
ncbi:hypothetical protein GCM10017674_23460 [Streptomyces gardneri]|uniref:Uncharacterized protein n=1 Tax=Streptomyces gardneri TaxID=66892 RepID=A0A4Y3RY76_9ACTN|nr:hypothetical protein SGA01_73520 [Streptomyces gardneri]GHG93618.1 hypothetical protein GCM10017674_23460 [Streptomyces gardneri]